MFPSKGYLYLRTSLKHSQNLLNNYDDVEYTTNRQEKVRVEPNYKENPEDIDY